MSIIKDYLDKAKLTYTQLAHKIKISPPAIHYWIAEKSIPSIRFAKKLQKVTGIPIEHWGYEKTPTGKIKKRKNVPL